MATNDGLRCIKNILEVVRTSVRESLHLHFNVMMDISPLATDSSSLAKDKIDFLQPPSHQLVWNNTVTKWVLF